MTVLESKAMSFGQIERESLCGELWTLWQENKLPYHLQLLVDREQQEQGKRDIWESPSQEPSNKSIHVSFDNNFSHSIKI
ncbi:hypothetical protein [Dendronalium sp. ChiSLP03b]|uniref:hypothetical protein n=1 Tax=Dendronalium sp. ChiSLP03b TaxID=3075381 RepID=UPI002AD339E4|nr:hypothetical protein [Dendronalium sp. ChiSLP03b]MDZ8205468.1 hypothetical protein [Dendronalium sp. ChiSLP03b]